MRYFSYVIRDPNRPADNNCIDTVSENDIRRTYWSDWYSNMCEKYEQSYVDENYSFEDCLEDWIVAHHAWESKD
jgi:hypothetical protein